MAQRATTARVDAPAAIGSGEAAQVAVVLVRLGDWIGAIPIERVNAVLPAVAVHGPDRSTRQLLGHVNVHGNIVPVADGRGIVGLRRRTISAADHLVLLTCDKGRVILPVDEALGVTAIDAEARAAVAAADLEEGRRPGLRPVSADRADRTVVTLIDAERVFGHLAEAAPGHPGGS
jgi:chemotaxis signal transduction protein